MRLQHRFHHISGVALRDAVERHTHAFEVQTHGIWGHFHRLPVHAFLRLHHGTLGRQLLCGLRLGPHLPQGLHGNIEGPGAAARHLSRQTQHRAQMRTWFVQHTRGVQA